MSTFYQIRETYMERAIREVSSFNFQNEDASFEARTMRDEFVSGFCNALQEDTLLDVSLPLSVIALFKDIQQWQLAELDRLKPKWFDFRPALVSKPFAEWMNEKSRIPYTHYVRRLSGVEVKQSDAAVRIAYIFQLAFLPSQNPLPSEHDEKNHSITVMETRCNVTCALMPLIPSSPRSV